MKTIDYVDLAAQLHGLKASELLDSSEKEDRVVIIIPSGQKYVYSKLALEESALPADGEAEREGRSSAEPKAGEAPKAATRPRSRSKASKEN